jgi:septum formation protein
MGLILASKSKRREMLLADLGLSFKIVPSHFDESSVRMSDPESLVRALAEEKAKAVAGSCPGSVIIGADTCVSISREILGQPKDMSDALRMLTLLSGRVHWVHGGICVMNSGSGAINVGHAVTEVKFRKLEDKEISAYIRTGLIFGKAGSYSIIDPMSSGFIERFTGSFTNIVGLPVELLVPMLAREGIAVGEEKYRKVISRSSYT